MRKLEELGNDYVNFIDLLQSLTTSYEYSWRQSEAKVWCAMCV